MLPFADQLYRDAIFKGAMQKRWRSQSEQPGRPAHGHRLISFMTQCITALIHAQGTSTSIGCSTCCTFLWANTSPFRCTCISGLPKRTRALVQSRSRSNVANAEAQNETSKKYGRNLGASLSAPRVTMPWF